MTESEEQREVVRWFRGEFPELSQAIRLSMNGINFGSMRSSPKGARMISMMRSQGMTDGETDLAFLIPNDQFHGLLIEMKTKNGKPTDKQLAYINFMNGQGYFATVCYGAEDAKRTIESYIRSHD